MLRVAAQFEFTPTGRLRGNAHWIGLEGPRARNSPMSIAIGILSPKAVDRLQTEMFELDRIGW
jgi:hypothetical protein